MTDSGSQQQQQQHHPVELSPDERAASASTKLALVALAAGAAPIVVSGALGALGPELDVLPLERALEASLVVAAATLAVAWPAFALAPAAQKPFVRGRALELVIIAAALAPGLRIAALLSEAPERLVARALVGLAVIGAAQGAWLASLASAGARRSTGVLLGATLALGLPLCVAYAREADLDPAPLATLSPPLAIARELSGRGDAMSPRSLPLAVFPLAAALALAAGAVALVARVRGTRAVAASIAVASLVFTASATRAQEPARASLELIAVKPLLETRARPGEVAPQKLQLRAGPQGFNGQVGVHGRGLLVLAKINLTPLEVRELALPAEGDESGSSLRIEASPESGVPFPLDLPPDARVPAPLPQYAPLAGSLEGADRRLVRALERPGQTLVQISGANLDLLSVAGGALDVLAVPAAALRDPGRRERILAFAAQGGTIVTDDASALALEGTGAGPLSSNNGLARRGLGAGELLAPAKADAIAPLASALAARLVARTRPLPEGLAEALAKSGVPRPSAAVSRGIALRALLLHAVLVLVVLAQGKRGRGALAGALAVASIALVLVIPRLALGATSPVVAESSAFIEAPSGGSISGTTEVLRLTSPRSAAASVRLSRAAPVAIVFESEAAAARSSAELRLVEPGAPTLEPGKVDLDLALGSEPAVFFRRTSRPLGGAVTIELTEAGSVKITNGLPVPLEHPLLVGRDFVIPLEDPLEPGKITTVALDKRDPAEKVFAQRVASAPAAERVRWELLRAAFAPRASGVSLRLTAFVSHLIPRQVEDGVLDEVEGPEVIVVRAP